MRVKTLTIKKIWDVVQLQYDCLVGCDRSLKTKSSKHNSRTAKQCQITNGSTKAAARWDEPWSFVANGSFPEILAVTRLSKQANTMPETQNLSLIKPVQDYGIDFGVLPSRTEVHLSGFGCERKFTFEAILWNPSEPSIPTFIPSLFNKVFEPFFIPKVFERFIPIL